MCNCRVQFRLIGFPFIIALAGSVSAQRGRRKDVGAPSSEHGVRLRWAVLACLDYFYFSFVVEGFVFFYAFRAPGARSL